MSKQAFVPQVSPAELTRIKAEQKREILWWKNYPIMRSQNDIDHQVSVGKAVRVHGNDFWRISANVNPSCHVLENTTHLRLQSITESWHQCVRREKLPEHDTLYLIVSSMARTTTLQGKLVLNGNPAVGDENSTHCRLGAFDFGIEGFIKYGRTDALGILDEILQDMHDRDLINWIKEPEINVYHVAINPNFKE